MKSHLSGFTLIELMISTAIATMVAGVLLAALSQGNRSKAKIDDAISLSERIAIVANQLEKDLMGAFIPTEAESSSAKAAAAQEDEEPKAPDKKSSSAKATADTADNKKTDAKATPAAEKPADKPKPIEKIFYSTNKENMLDTLTFITNDPLTVYVSKDAGEVKPKVARVQYTLRADEKDKKSYTLFRQESKELDLAEYKNVRPYELISGIKKCTVKFIARIEKKQEKNKPADKAEKQKEREKIEYEYKELSEWVSEQKKESSSANASSKASATADRSAAEGEKEQQEFPRIPYQIEFYISLWDIQEKKDKKITLLYEIPVDFKKPKKEEKKQLQPLEDEQKAQQGNKKPQQQGGKDGGQEMVMHQGISIETLSGTLNSLMQLLKQM